MGREVRKVPADWQHPSNENGNYIPLWNCGFAKDSSRYNEELEQWNKGFRRHYGTGGWVPKDADEHTMSFAEYEGSPPVAEDYMPDWEESVRTHWQMYENTTEGTPISPVLESPNLLARWLADNNASAFGSMTATYDQWLSTIGAGSAMSLVVDSKGNMSSGVEFSSKI